MREKLHEENYSRFLKTSNNLQKTPIKNEHKAQSKRLFKSNMANKECVTGT